ncbi:MAG: NUDIX domain-containing protein [Thiolinea sp.]
MVLNQPAGHLEYGESLLDAVRRETLEETGYRFEPEALLGMILGHSDDPDRVYLRLRFAGASGKVADQPLDDDITAVHWLTPQQIRAHERLTPRNPWYCTPSNFTSRGCACRWTVFITSTIPIRHEKQIPCDRRPVRRC